MLSLRVLFPLTFITGFIIRLLLLNNKSLSQIFENRIEISTPLSSWKRAVEGVALSKRHIDPYVGDVYHESPLMLSVYSQIVALDQVSVIFSICDIITAAVLALSSWIYLKNTALTESKIENYPKTSHPLLLTTSKINLLPLYVASVYLFCPYAIASCCGKSTATFLNCVVSFFILLSTSGYFLFASIILGLLAYHSIYHVCLIAPLVLFIVKDSAQRNSSLGITKAILASFVTIATICSMLVLSHEKMGSWQFLSSTYGFTLSVPDLTPNIGLFWYFFTEMFEHFRIFFLCTFQLNAFIYTVPLGIRLRNKPMLLLFIHLMLIPLFKSYPCIGDIVLYLALLPMYQHLFMFMRQSFLVGCVFVSCSLLAPTLWHLWIYSGSANANFYFAISLAFNTGQIFLLTDVLSASIKREYYLANGVELDANGKLILLQLQ